MKIKLSGDWATRDVFINGEWLDPRPSQRVYNHSPDGFNWGYGGSGPAQLALGILLKFTDKEIAVELHQFFKFDVISRLPQGNFEVEVDVGGWIERQYNHALFIERCRQVEVDVGGGLKGNKKSR